jgi:beta-glucosidase
MPRKPPRAPSFQPSSHAAPATNALTRRALLARAGAGAGAAALASLGCATGKGAGAGGAGHAGPSAAVPPARRAGTPAPELEALLGQMTLDEKIGQMTQIDLKIVSRNESIIRDYFLGSVLSGADSLPRPNEPGSWGNTYDAFQSQALTTRLGIPLVYGVDAVHGHGAVKGAVIFPHQIGLGCTRSPELVEAVARITAREVAGTGIDWNFAPCLAVPRDERWGRTYEGFGETAELAESLGAARRRHRGRQGSRGRPDTGG